MNWFLNLKIKQKILLMAFVIVVIFISVNVFAFLKMDQIRKDNKSVSQILLPDVYHISDMSLHCYNFRLKEYKHVFSTSKEEKEALETEMDSIFSDFQYDRKAAIQLINSQNESKLFNEFEISFAHYFDLHKKILTSSKNGNFQEARRILLNESKNSFDEFTNKLNALVIMNMSYVTTSTIKVNKVFSNSLKLVLVLSTLSLLLIVLFSLWISKKISDPIRKLEIAANSLANGNIISYIESPSKDEIGSLFQAFNKMSENISKTLNEINDLNASLEEKILERTGKLEDINKVLQSEITERKKAEVQIAKYVNDLKESNDTKDKFLSIIAHDLKSPFSSLLGISEVLMEKVSIEDDTKIDEYIRLINQSASNCYRLLENLLSWATSKSGKMKICLNSLNISHVIDENIFLLAPTANKKHITLIKKINGSTLVYADNNMVHTIVRNLINNAIKFSNSESEIIIKTDELDGKVQIAVIDQGIGIEGERLGNLFKIDAARTTPGTSNEKGTGLGLLLCKEFVEKNGGEIWVQSKHGNGSSFFFTLPSYKPSMDA